MKAERWREVDKLLKALLEQEPDQRGVFLQEARVGDEGLRREVEELLAHEQTAEGFLEVPALTVAAGAMGRHQADSVLGQSIGSYRILSLVGTGGMGEVYLAEDVSLDRKVALKFLPELMRQDPTARKRFLCEAKSAAALDHPYICQIHEVGEAEGKGFICMEYVQGKTLTDKLAKGPLPLRDALQKATEIAEALEAAHKHNIVHRDLKPSNIMLTPEGHVKVMDFGLAKRIELQDQEQEITTLTQSGEMVGTVPYMSPEQLRGEKIDPRSDIFSFGVVLYEMLTGVHPFKKAELMETGNAILNEAPAPLSHYLNDASPVLQRT